MIPGIIGSIIVVTVAVFYFIRKRHPQKAVFNPQALTHELSGNSLNEFVIVTDPSLTILSLNDAAAAALQKSRAELLNKHLLEVFLLKEKNGNVVSKETFAPTKDTEEYILIRASFPPRNIILHIQSLTDLTGKMNHISFVMRFKDQPLATEAELLNITIDKAKTKYEAISEHVKKILFQKHKDIGTKILLLQKIENDVFEAQFLQAHIQKNTINKVDLAQLAMQTAKLEQEFANALHVPLTFTIRNFGQQDIQPLVKDYSIRPDQFTGPFFTVDSDFKKLEIIIKKLIDIGIFLASTESKPGVNLSIEREDQNKTILIQMTTNCPKLPPANFKDLFIPYYGSLSSSTNLRTGSGLEGFLIKNLCEQLNIQVATNYHETTPSSITITLQLPEQKNNYATYLTGNQS